jgi:hypothetical protein
MDRQRLHEILMELEERLSDVDLRRLKFLLGNNVLQRTQHDPTLDSTLILMEFVSDSDTINEQDIIPLLNALNKIERMDIAQLLEGNFFFLIELSLFFV